jgi:DNA (cytosine-5)-methyltransferase 1
MRHLDLFSGIGGFALAARNVGWETVGFCEIDPWCRRILDKHWPGVKQYEDVRDVTATRLRADGIFPKIITGGFPCQDISHAGKQAGIEGERSGLWSELARIISEVRPDYAVLENVSALLSGDSGRWFGRVLGDLAEIGYDCEWHCIPASAVGAPHQRDRVWIVAYPNEQRLERSELQRKRVSKQQGIINNSRKVADTISPVADTITDRKHRSQSALKENDRDSIGGSSTLVSDTKCERQQRQGQYEQSERPATAKIGQAIKLVDGRFRYFWATEPNVGKLVDGLPARLAGFRGLTDDQRWIQIPCEKAAEECLRDLRKHKASLRSSYRQGLEEQRPIEFDDAVQFLSHIIASCSGRDNAEERETALQALRENVLSSGNVQHAPDEVQEVWQSIDDTAADWFIMATCLGRDWADSPIGRVVGRGVPRRVNRLKGLGNAIVPQVAQILFEAINEKESYENP